MLIFTAKNLKTVLQEVREHQCALLLVKDQGVYLMAEKGEMRPEKGRHVAYAEGCDPNQSDDPGDFYQWINHYCGGDDFGEVLSLEPEMQALILSGEANICIELTEQHLKMTTPRHVPHIDGVYCQFDAPDGQTYQYDDTQIYYRDEEDGWWHFLAYHLMDNPTPEAIWEEFRSSEYENTPFN